MQPVFQHTDKTWDIVAKRGDSLVLYGTGERGLRYFLGCTGRVTRTRPVKPVVTVPLLNFQERRSRPSAGQPVFCEFSGKCVKVGAPIPIQVPHSVSMYQWCTFSYCKSITTRLAKTQRWVACKKRKGIHFARLVFKPSHSSCVLLAGICKMGG